MKHKFSLVNTQLFLVPPAIEGGGSVAGDLCENTNTAYDGSNNNHASDEGNPGKENKNDAVSQQALAVDEEAVVVQ